MLTHGVKQKDMPDSLKPLPSRQTLLKNNQPDFSVQEAKLLGKLKMVSYEDRKDRNPHRVPGTCEWFVSHRLFNSWLTGSQDKDCQALWVSADPGCGKSVLAKHLIDDVLPSTQSRTTCYFFFKDDFEDQKSAANAMCCILHQLFTQNPTLFSPKVHTQLEAEGEKLTVSFRNLWKLLLEVAREKYSGEILCIFDALDECAENDRQLLAKALLDQHRTKEAPNLKFLLTSRPFGSIRRDLQPFDTAELAVVHLSGENEEEMKNISKEIDIFIKARVQGVGAKLKLDEDEQDMLLRGLLSVPHRTYLWVYLTLDYVESKESINKRKIKEALSHLPNSVDEAYEKILLASSEPNEARRALHIIVAAERPLTVREMNFALAIRPSHQSYQDVDLDSDQRFRERLRNMCGLFVVIIDSKIYLLHQTAKEFLVMTDPQHGPPKTPRQQPTKSGWKHSLKRAESHQILGEICLWNLRFSDICEYTPRSLQLIPRYIYRGIIIENPAYPFKVRSCLCEYEFLEYSAYFWAVHLRELHGEIDKKTTQAMLEICHQNLQWWFRVVVDEENCVSSIVESSITRDAQPSLKVASYLGLVAVVQACVKARGRRLSAWDSQEREALAWAAACGHADVVRVLIDRQPRMFLSLRRLGVWNPSFLDLWNSRQMAPLLLAAEAGWEGVVKLLLDNGARLEERNYLDETPLLLACTHVMTDVVRLLLERGARVEARDKNGETPLVRASQRRGGRAVDTIRLLLQFGAAVDGRESRRGMTPLMSAIQNQCDDNASLLLENGADIEAKSTQNCCTPFILACNTGMLDIAKTLLKRGVNIKHTDEDGRSALAYACRSGHNHVVQFLVEQGLDIESRCNGGWTPLYYCMVPGTTRREDVGRFLLDLGADLEARVADGRSILAAVTAFAYSFDNVKVVKWLLEQGADIESQNVHGETPLVLAARSCWHNTALALFEAGANANVTARDGRSVLQLIIVCHGRPAFVESLLERGVNIEHKDNEDRTALSHAASCYTESAGTIVSMLLKKGADIHSKDNQGRAALSYAASLDGESAETIVDMLLKKGADIHSTDNQGRTALSHAASCDGKLAQTIVGMLLKKGADIHSKDNRGRTPLFWATANPTGTAIARVLIEHGADTRGMWIPRWRARRHVVRGKAACC